MKKNILKPLGNRVVLLPLKEEEKTSSGIILPDSAQKDIKLAEVIVVSAENKFELKEGDRVVLPDYGYDKIEIDGTEYYLIEENKILAIINN